MLGAFVMDQQQQAAGGGMPSQQAAGNEGKLEHLQDVAGLKLMVMQMEKAREAMAQEKKEKKKNSFSWTHVLYEFSQNTTMHGISKTTEDTPFLLRRMIWILVVLGGISLFLYQLSTSIMTYLSYPVTVNVQINHNKSLDFPTVTICNLNVFRTTKADELGYYELIHEIYDPARTHNISADKIPAGMTLERIYKELVHAKEDMIKSCWWDSHKCSAKDFKVTHTDHGVCYSFNAGGENPLQVTQTGSDHGLRLRLNIEQYEYMRGPNKGAGIKVLVYGRSDVALVRDLGQAIPPGAHAFIGVQLKKMTNLQPPFGECNDDKHLRFFDQYSQSKCSMDCITEYLSEKCNCRLKYMPRERLHEHPVVCDMEQFVNCVPSALETFNVDRVHFCQCPVPCRKLIYEASVTYASTSHFDTDQVLQNSDIGALQNRYIAAKEVHQRVDKQVAEKDKLLVKNLIETSSTIDTSIRAINQSLADAQSSMESIYKEMQNRAFFHKYVTRKIIQGYQYWFAQGWELTSKMIDELIGGHAGFVKTYNNTMTALTQNNHQQSFQEVLIWQIMQEASERFHLAEKVVKEFKNVQDSYTNCTPIFEYPIEFADAYVKLLVPETVMEKRRKYSHQLFAFILEYLTNVVNRYNLLLDKVTEVSKDSSYDFDMTVFKNITDDLEEDIKSINLGQKTYDREVVNYPGELLGRQADNFEGAMADMAKECDDLMNTLKKTRSLLNNFERNWDGVRNFIKESNAYIDDKKLGKATLSVRVNSIDHQVEAMRTFFTDVRSRARNLDHDWTKVFIMYENSMKEIAMEKSTKALYAKLNEDVNRMLKSDDRTLQQEIWSNLPFPRTPGNGNADEMWPGHDMFQYQKYANLDTAFMNETDVDNLVISEREKVNNVSDISKAIDDKDINFFASFDEWEKDLDFFNTSTKVDSGFFRENFIDLDIYLTELYYEEIDQQQAYDLTSLFSDIGGSMGLFIGASVITIIELIDIIFLSLFKTKCSCRA